MGYLLKQETPCACVETLLTETSLAHAHRAPAREENPRKPITAQRGEKLAPADRERGSIRTSITPLVDVHSNSKQKPLERGNYRSSDGRETVLLWSKEQVA